MVIERMKFITREYIQSHPQKIFLFGDNVERKGFGGQAREMRGEPNAMGIVTKTKPTNDIYSFFMDSQLEYNKILIDRDFAELHYRIEALREAIGEEPVIVLPEDGIGTGLAKLEAKAPLTYNYLQSKLKGLELGKDWLSKENPVLTS